MKYDFKGWATKANMRCSDGRIIMPNAFIDNDGGTVPLVFNHSHNDITDVLGHALLENRPEGVYAYCTFNSTAKGQTAKELVKNGDIKSLSIFANKLKQNGSYVEHGVIKEVSLVLAGANPGALIQEVYMAHGEDEDTATLISLSSEDCHMELYHSEEKAVENKETQAQEQESVTTEESSTSETLEHADSTKTVADVINTMNEEQKTAMYALIQQILEDENNNDSKGDSEEMIKHNIFESDSAVSDNTLTAADGFEILKLAKSKNVGSLQHAISLYAEEHFGTEDGDSLQHGFDDIDVLFPEYKDVTKIPPEIIGNDQSWISAVMDGASKSPFSRIRTKYTDIRDIDLAYGYSDRTKKKKAPQNAKFIVRTTDPQTIYRKEALHRDDIVDITDFDVVQYQYTIMKQQLNEMIALAILIGDGREDGAEEKIYQEHVRSIWLDEELYTRHFSVKTDGDYPQEILDAISLTGDVTDYTDNYKYTEAILASILIAREKYKGSGNPAIFMDPHTVNLMLLTRDLNGRRIYNDISDLAKAMNVSAVHTVEQFANKERFGSAATQDADKKYTLIALLVNMKDYTIGATKGGEITKFNQFDIDFNQEKYLIETRISGALTKIQSAIAFEICETING